MSYRDRLSHALHFALVRGEPDPSVPTLVRVHMLNPLADALHWRRPDFGPAVGGVLRTIAAEGRGALAEWRRTGVGSQILADLGLGKLRVIGSPRKQVGLAGFGLELIEYVDPSPAG